MSCGAVIEDALPDSSDLSFSFTGDATSAHHSRTSFLEEDKGLGTPQPRLKGMHYSPKRLHLDEPVDPVERGFKAALPWLRLACSALSLPRGVELASATLYRKCIRKQLTRGRKAEALALACVAAACGNAGMAKDLSLAARPLGVSMELVGSYAGLVRSEAMRAPAPYVHDYVRSGIARLELPKEIGDKAVMLADEIVGKRKELGKHPAVVAGAMICRAIEQANASVRRIEVAKALEVSERSIRRYMQEVY